MVEETSDSSMNVISALLSHFNVDNLCRFCFQRPIISTILF